MLRTLFVWLCYAFIFLARLAFIVHLLWGSCFCCCDFSRLVRWNCLFFTCLCAAWPGCPLVLLIFVCVLPMRSKWYHINNCERSFHTIRLSFFSSLPSNIGAQLRIGWSISPKRTSSNGLFSRAAQHFMDALAIAPMPYTSSTNQTNYWLCSHLIPYTQKHMNKKNDGVNIRYKLKE